MHTQNKPLQRLISIRPYTHSKQANHTVPPINTQTIAPKVVCQNKHHMWYVPLHTQSTRGGTSLKTLNTTHHRRYIPIHIQNKTPQIIYMYFYTYSKQNSTDGTSLSKYTQNKARERVPPIHTQTKHHRCCIHIHTQTKATQTVCHYIYTQNNAP